MVCILSHFLYRSFSAPLSLCTYTHIYMYMQIVFPETLGSGRYHASLCLNTSVLFPMNKNIILHNHNMIICIKMLTYM